MTYPEFKTDITRKIGDYFGANYEITINEVRKNNDLHLDGLVIKSDDCNVSPTIYLNYFYDRYTCGATISEVVEMIVDIYQKRKLDLSLDLAFVNDYSLVKEKVIYRLVNYEKNKAHLENVPHTRYLDLAVIFYYSLENIGGYPGWIQITNKQINQWEVTREQIIADAAVNTPRLFPHQCLSMSEMFENIMSIAEEDPLDFDDMTSPFHVLTNKDKFFGAAVILYKDLLKRIAEHFGESLYVIPSSVHEVLLIPMRDMSKEAINRMITEINHEHLTQDEVLSDHVYTYDLKENALGY